MIGEVSSTEGAGLRAEQARKRKFWIITVLTIIGAILSSPNRAPSALGAIALVMAGVGALAGPIQAVRLGVGLDPSGLPEPALLMLPALGFSLAGAAMNATPSPVHGLQDQLELAFETGASQGWSTRRRAAFMVMTSLGLWAIIAAAARTLAGA